MKSAPNTVWKNELPQIREVIEGSFRIIHYIKPDGIDVLAVIHAAQNTLNEGEG